ncbi:uncharacterized protein AMSG_12337 [Thecamonas trahens ATCC 50062]|uniref:Guanylate cyclase domain-containing protein n=1 Tax=Thecamonas trahens ATCC 50062 TaxID=461836 RepID=A0A0L0DPR1_THETB|nr:hypothetical protein AMSG_12337 [Thecamonas trahens ATCC 50062]KNC54294.1 hypothetical protein AMSG_12337 [Thecamonas trahens ATCC 50062]|eukprot:XP_013753820.1 hypothetical protein AMSG_12337 [Thecamonas trahens ATCC 50062]
MPRVMQLSHSSRSHSLQVCIVLAVSLAAVVLAGAPSSPRPAFNYGDPDPDSQRLVSTRNLESARIHQAVQHDSSGYGVLRLPGDPIIERFGAEIGAGEGIVASFHLPKEVDPASSEGLTAPFSAHFTELSGVLIERVYPFDAAEVCINVSLTITSPSRKNKAFTSGSTWPDSSSVYAVMRESAVITVPGSSSPTLLGGDSWRALMDAAWAEGNAPGSPIDGRYLMLVFRGCNVGYGRAHPWHFDDDDDDQLASDAMTTPEHATIGLSSPMTLVLDLDRGCPKYTPVTGVTIVGSKSASYNKTVELECTAPNSAIVGAEPGAVALSVSLSISGCVVLVLAVTVCVVLARKMLKRRRPGLRRIASSKHTLHSPRRAQTELTTLPPAASGPVVVLLVIVDDADILWADAPGPMDAAWRLFMAAASRIVQVHRGYGVEWRAHTFAGAFPRDAALDAVVAAVALQNELISLPWPEALLGHTAAAAVPVEMTRGDPRLTHDAVGYVWRGLRIRVAVDTNVLPDRLDVERLLVPSIDEVLEVAEATAEAIRPGQVVASAEVVSLLPSPVPSPLYLDCISSLLPITRASSMGSHGSLNSSLSPPAELYSVAAHGSVLALRDFGLGRPNSRFSRPAFGAFSSVGATITNTPPPRAPTDPEVSASELSSPQRSEVQMVSVSPSPDEIAIRSGQSASRQNLPSAECDPPAFLDACGICSGPGTGHVANADVDGCGVCFGKNNDLDECGVCFGENRDKDVCGVCFGGGEQCTGCDGVAGSGTRSDVCGVCGGDASSCLGCDGIPIPLGGAHYDGCGVCGGSSGIGECATGCSPDGSGVYDCAGECGGSAYMDGCGACVGGSTGRTESFARDDCEMCWGGNAAKDTCGVCFGTNAALDSCGVCHGGDRARDGCGRCWGGNKTMDVCGVCGGNSTSCAGCDWVVGSSARVDSCGVCGGTSSCIKSGSSSSSLGTTIAVTVSLALCFLCSAIGLIAALFFFTTRGSHAVSPIDSEQAETGSDGEAISPPDGVVIVFTTMVKGAELLRAEIPAALNTSCQIYRKVVRAVVKEYRGYVVTTSGGMITAVFPADQAVAAATAAMTIHDRLVEAEWPKEILTHRRCRSKIGRPIWNAPFGRLMYIWRGLRVCVALHACLLERETFPDGSVMYSGSGLGLASTLAHMCDAGSVGVSISTLEMFPSPMPSHMAISPMAGSVRSQRRAHGAQMPDAYSLVAFGHVVSERRFGERDASASALMSISSKEDEQSTQFLGGITRSSVRDSFVSNANSRSGHTIELTPAEISLVSGSTGPARGHRRSSTRAEPDVINFASVHSPLESPGVQRAIAAVAAATEAAESSGRRRSLSLRPDGEFDLW